MITVFWAWLALVAVKLNHLLFDEGFQYTTAQQRWKKFCLRFFQWTAIPGILSHPRCDAQPGLWREKTLCTLYLAMKERSGVFPLGSWNHRTSINWIFKRPRSSLMVTLIYLLSLLLFASVLKLHKVSWEINRFPSSSSQPCVLVSALGTLVVWLCWTRRGQWSTSWGESKLWLPILFANYTKL